VDSAGGLWALLRETRNRGQEQWFAPNRLAKCNIPLLLQMSLITIRHRCELAHIGPGLAAACWVRVIRAAEAASCGLRSPHREKSRAVSGVERLL
jgi:hypothetical protein